MMMGRSELLKEFGFKEEVTETLERQYGKTGFPKPHKTYRMYWELYDLSMEEPYFWILDTLKQNFPIIDKLEDSFAAAENSAFFGVTQQRLGAQQDKVSQFLATTGKMIKELFQMVRELRIIDERLGYYKQVAVQLERDLKAREKGAEITLKGFFVDLVQGGGKSAASVYGMARELEFITLPDLFFDAPPFRTSSEVEKHINSLEKDFNKNVLRVLHRHLTQYMQWRKRTHSEHVNRKQFMLKYLDQHFQIINMYITWIKPYLRNVRNLSLNQKAMSSADLISGFEGSMLDVEFLARRRIPIGDSGANGCVLATFQYRTRPEMKVVSEGYQRGPVHIGGMTMELRVYTWTDEEVENYKKLKQKETLELFGDVSESVRGAMESLGDVLEKYLEEARGLKKEKKEEKKETKQKKGLKGLFGEFYRSRPKRDKDKAQNSKEAKVLSDKLKSTNEGLIKGVKFTAWNTYKNFKKAHRMIQW